VVARVPYPAIKAEAERMGLPWREITGLLVQTFDDGTVVVVVQRGEHPNAERFVTHLVNVGMADRECGPPPSASKTPRDLHVEAGALRPARRRPSRR